MKLTDPKLLSHFIDAIYQSVTAPENIVNVMGELSGALNTPYAGFQVENCYTAELGMAHLINYDDGAIKTYSDYYVTRDPWTQRALACKEFYGKFVPGHRVLADKHLINSEFYNDWGKSEGVRYAIGTFFPLDDGQMLKFSFQRGTTEGDFSNEIEHFLNLLRPHFAQFVALSPIFEAQKTQRQHWMQILQGINRPVWIVDRRGYMHFANGHAETHMAQKGGFELASRVLCASALNEDRSLKKALYETGMEPADSASLKQTNVSRYRKVSVGGANYWLMPILSDYHLGERLIAILGPVVVPAAKHLAASYELTLRQAQLCLLLSAGKSLQDIAQELNVSINTARNHMYECFARLNVKNQSELILHLFGGLRLYDC